MDTLTISQTLQTAGLERKSAEAIAKIVDEKNQEIATKQDIKDLRWLKGAGYVVIGIGFGYVISLLNTLISKV